MKKKESKSFLSKKITKKVDAQKIGIIPPGFSEKDIVFMEGGKIYISHK